MDNQKVIAFFPMTIPASGKTVLFTSIEQYFKAKYGDQAMIFLIQSDIVTQQLMKEFLAKNPKSTHDDAFNESRKTYRKAYEDRISNVCYEAKKSQINLVIIIFDKNHPENALNSPISILKKQFNNLTIIGIIPKIEKSYKNNMFSLQYLVSCAQRALKRKDHETLIGNPEKVASIVLFFFKFFNHIDQTKLPFNKLISVPFTNEFQEQEKIIRNALQKDLFDIFGQKNPEEIQQNCGEQLQRFIQFCEQNDLGFPDKQIQYKVIQEAIENI